MLHELPLRVVDEPGGPYIRCLCGAEATVMRPELDHQRGGVVRTNRARLHAGSDLSPAALIRMVAHAKQCMRGQNLLEEER